MTIAEPVLDPAISRRNRSLGLVLGALVVVIVVSFFFIFSRNGLPKDPDVWRKLHREGQAGYPLGVAPDGTMTDDDVPVQPAPQESTQ